MDEKTQHELSCLWQRQKELKEAKDSIADSISKIENRITALLCVSEVWKTEEKLLLSLCKIHAELEAGEASLHIPVLLKSSKAINTEEGSWLN